MGSRNGFDVESWTSFHDTTPGCVMPYRESRPKRWGNTHRVRYWGCWKRILLRGL